ncbi:uncharacterized protein [Rutidosis leptorrhynchoides]|uniref:uncharacterized protein isoform X2 n=1 Tax=Rutidosis leptorrhynchoides TaxID=125765 RepID=UPI003A99CEB3
MACLMLISQRVDYPSNGRCLLTVDFMGFKQPSLRSSYANPSSHLGDRRQKRMLGVGSNGDPNLRQYVRRPRRQPRTRSLNELIRDSEPRLRTQTFEERHVQTVNDLIEFSKRNIVITAQIVSLKVERERVEEQCLQCVRDPRLRHQEYQLNFDRTKFEEVLRNKSFVPPWQVELLQLHEKLDVITLALRLLEHEKKTNFEKSRVAMLFDNVSQSLSI